MSNVNCQNCAKKLFHNFLMYLTKVETKEIQFTPKSKHILTSSTPTKLLLSAFSNSKLHGTVTQIVP